MIVPTASDGGVTQDLATVAEDEKIRLTTTVYAKNRYQDHICYDESKNHSLDEQRQSGVAVPSEGRLQSANPMSTLLSLANR